MNFSRSHLSMLIKYIGISFITGAISHGFFSGTRSLLTGLFGVGCFIVGTLLEEDATNTVKTILLGAILAVGIGSVTGGLQHFPDSPERSLLIIPIGYVIAVFLYAYIHNYTLRKKEYQYIVISSLVTLIATLGIYFLIEKTNITGHTHNSVIQDSSHASMDPMDMSMNDMQSMLAGKTGDDLDRAFLESMIPHHQGAIDMARYLTGAKHVELQQLGQEIITTQEKEILQMKQWLIDWGYQDSSVEGDIHHAH